MKLKQLVYFLFFFQSVLFARSFEKDDSLPSWDGKCGSRVYYSLAEAAKVHPDSVICLELGNNGLRKFPREVLKYKNLRRLSFTNLNLAEQYERTPWILSEAEKAKVVEIYAKHRVAGSRGIMFYFPTKNKTKIRYIPKEIKSLEKLRWLDFTAGIFYKRKVKRLQKLLPSCEIDFD